MRKLWGGGPRVVSAVAAIGALTVASFVPPAAALGDHGSTPPASQPAPPSTTTLPALPTVSPTYTDGQSPQALLNNAISLSSVGHDGSALIAAVSATQVKLDADAATARKAEGIALAAEAAAGRARQSFAAANAAYRSMTSAMKQAIIQIYTAGPGGLAVSPAAGQLGLYARDYAYSAMSPYGVLARSRAVQQQRAVALQTARRQAGIAAAAFAQADNAARDQQAQLDRLKAELASVSVASAQAVTADHVTLASQAGKELLSASSLEFNTTNPLPAPVSTTPIALTWAFAELGKAYVWGATGPQTFDCSGLTQFVWKAAGVQIPRVAADQDSWAIPVPLSQLLPGDLVFFGTTDIHHVGIYIGDGLMINAPHTGTVVQVSSIWWSDLAGFGRVHAAGTPVPLHNTPTPTQPATPVVVSTAGLVPSQIKPPANWKPQPGSSTPIRLGSPISTTVPSATTSTTTGVSVDPTTTDSTTTSTTVPVADSSGTTTTVAPAPTTTTTAVSP